MTEARQTQALYQEASRYASLDIDKEAHTIVQLLAPNLPQGFPFAREFATTIVELLNGEAHLFALPDNDWSYFTLEDHVNTRAILRRRIEFLKNKDQRLGSLREGIVRLLSTIVANLPAPESTSPFTAPLINVTPHGRALVHAIFAFFYEDDFIRWHLFQCTREQLRRNWYVASGEPKDANKLVSPLDSTLSLEECGLAYLGGTPFENLINLQVPLPLSNHIRFHHWHVLGGAGAGKTTLLENVIVYDLKSEERPALVIIDPHEDLFNKLTHLAVLENIRHVIIDPRDIENPPALNIFDVNRTRLDGYDQMTREQVQAGVIQTFDFIFKGLVGADLSAKQGVFFEYIARLMLVLPETLGRSATILDLLHIMKDSTPYLPAIQTLPDIPRSWFGSDFLTSEFKGTKEQLKYRLHALIANPTFARLFTSPATKVDLFDELNNGSLILVNTSQAFLKGASQGFGRMFIALVLQAILERASIPEAQRRPAFLVVDEAAEYFDQNIDNLLTEARKFKLGCLFAHQYLDQASSALRASLASNTSIKFAGGVSTHDARAVASDMRTTPDFILAQPQRQFAAFIKGVTDHAISVPARLGVLDAEPKLSDAAYEQLIARNRERVSLGANATNASRPPNPDEDVSETW